MTFLSTIFGRRRQLDAVRSEPDRYCRMCGEGGASSLGFVEPTHPAQFHTNKFQLVLCPGCDVVYLDPLPTAEDLNLLYEQSVQFADAHYTDSVRVEKILDYYATAVHNLGLLPERGARTLEIGAGLAWVSRVCKKADPTTFTVAQDVSGECETSCPWVDSYFVGALDAMPEKGPYQLISLTHVIEHLPDPAAILRSIATLLAPGGKLFVTAPFRPSGWMPTRGIEPWRTYSYLHVPAHITYLSRRWFEKQAQSHDLEIVHWDNSHEGGQAFELVMRRT